MVGGEWRCILPGAALLVEAEPKYCSVGVSWVKMLEKAGSARTAKVPAPGAKAPVSASPPATSQSAGSARAAPIDQSAPAPVPSHGGAGGRGKNRGRR